MPQLVSMKLDAKDREKSYPSTVAADAPMYPYGLMLSLDNETLEKIGTGRIPEVGGQVLILAKAKVTSMSSNESEGGQKYQSVSLQITDLGLDTPDQQKAAADMLYDGKG